MDVYGRDLHRRCDGTGFIDVFATSDAGQSLHVRDTSPGFIETSFEGDRGALADEYSWRRVSGPAVTITGLTTATPSFTCPLMALPTSTTGQNLRDVSVRQRQARRPPPGSGHGTGWPLNFGGCLPPHLRLPPWYAVAHAGGVLGDRRAA